MGPLLCLLSAACFGALPVFGKLAYEAGVTPSTALLIRFALAAALLTALLGARPGSRRTTAPLRRRTVLTALGLGAVGYAMQAGCYFAALEVMDASALSLILYTYPVLVTVGAVLLGRERLTTRRSTALAAASAGTLLVLLGAGGGFNVAGVLLGFGAAVTYTGYILVADTVVREMPPVVLTALVMTGATAAFAVRELASGGPALDFAPAGWFWLACIAVVSTVVAALAFFAGLRRTGASTAAILSTFEPVVTTALAAVVLGESLTAAQLAGGVLVLASIAVLQTRGRTAARAGGPEMPGRRAAAEARRPLPSGAPPDRSQLLAQVNAGVLAEPVAMKPKVVDVPAARDPL